MSVRISASTIFLEGDCPVEDAAKLLEQLALHPRASVDWSECDSMHTGVFQVLLAGRPQLVGIPAGDFVRAHLAPLLMRGGPPGPPLAGR